MSGSVIVHKQKKTALTGGMEQALDSIDGATLLDGDYEFVIISNNFYVYILDADLGGAESSPTIIAPDTNPGTKRWVLQGYSGVITANTGYIGGIDGWVISPGYIKDVAGLVGLSTVVTGGDDIRFWAGHVTPASAPFKVTESGVLVATSAIITGLIQGSYLSGSSIFTKGTYLAVSCLAADATLNVGDTTDFAASGSASFIDSANDRDAFTYTGKTGTTLTGCSGVLAHTVSATNKPLVVPSIKGMYISGAANEMRFFGDRGDGTIEELASIGITGYGTDYTVGFFGSVSSTHIAIVGLSKSNYGVLGQSRTKYGIWGASYSSYGVMGQSDLCYGGYFIGDSMAPILLSPSVSASAPTHIAGVGALWVTSAGILYINTDGGTTWGKVGAQ